ncbi:MAG: DUF4097 family beta strand repeat-containing protein [Candidatus Faecousia sp.]|nr:DUF4097 family beta strand repeat-containing protein [Candidatus Faecousia sp.]
MREKIAQYMDLYYAGSGLSEDRRQQLLQEALDLYDSLILEGKSEQESYAQVIAWIGAQTQPVPHPENTQKTDAAGEAKAFTPMGKRICTAIAVMLYILCPIPLILLQNVIGLSCLLGMVACGVAIQILAEKFMDTPDPMDPISKAVRPILHASAVALYVLSPIPLLMFQNTVGLCCLLGMVAVGVAMQIIAGSGKADVQPKAEADPVRKSIDSLVCLILLAIYLIVSFRTHAWWITWIIFPIGAAVKDLVLSLAAVGTGKAPAGSTAQTVIKAILIVVLFSLLGSAVWGIGRTNHMPLWNWARIHLNSGSELSADNNFISESTVQNVSFDASEVKKLHIEWVSGNVTLKTADQHNVTFRVDGDSALPFSYQLSGNELDLRYPADNALWKPAWGSKNLTVTVPQSWYARETNIDVVSAVVEVDGLSTEELKLDTTSGPINASGLCCDQIVASTVSGNVSLEGTAEELKLDTTSGRCQAELDERVREIELDSVSGELELILPESLGFEAEVDTVSGSFRSDIPTTASSKGVYTCGNGECGISVDTVSGSISIQKK